MYNNDTMLQSTLIPKHQPVHDKIPILKADAGPHVPELCICGLSEGSKHLADAGKGKVNSSLVPLCGCTELAETVTRAFTTKHFFTTLRILCFLLPIDLHGNSKASLGHCSMCLTSFGYHEITYDFVVQKTKTSQMAQAVFHVSGQ